MYASGSAHIPGGICFEVKSFRFIHGPHYYPSFEGDSWLVSAIFSEFLGVCDAHHPLPVLLLVQVAWKTGPGATGDCPSE